MLTLYGIANCNTVKKARNWLDTQGVVYIFHDFKKLGVDEATINHWLSLHPWDELINRAGLTWRNLGTEVKSTIVDNHSALMLMQNKTSLIKRPILVGDHKIMCLGFNETIYKEIFKS